MSLTFMMAYLVMPQGIMDHIDYFMTLREAAQAHAP
jgi:hypothetical protein